MGSLGADSTAGLVEWAAKGLRTETVKDIPREKCLSV